MDALTLAILLALPLLLAASALCSSVETALFSLTYQDQARLKKLAPGAARAAAALLRNPREFLVSLLFINMICTTLYFVLTSLLLLEAPSPWIGIAISVVNLVLMTVGAEVVSKMLAARRRVEFARFLAPPTLLTIRAMGPLRIFLDRGIIAPLSRLILPHESARQTDLTAEELAALLGGGGGGETDTHIDSGEREVLREVIHMGSVRVREIMLPRVEIEWLPETATPAEVAELAAASHATRVPVCRALASATGLDGEVLGMLDVKGYLGRWALGGGAGRTQAPPIADFLGAVRFVPENAALDGLLEQMRTSGAKAAFCVDEHGAILGLVSLRDVVKRLIAELGGTEESVGERSGVEQIDTGRWLVPGRLSARDWGEMFGLPIDPRVSTVAGVVYALLGSVPVVGDSVAVQNVVLTVKEVRGRVVELVEVAIVSEAHGGAAGFGPPEREPA
ncbi:MAG: CNNM domain-containing protein [Phycisphaerales bacterium]